ncbi:MAG: hypothetical protein ACYC2K_01510 [Gemmatimonadales bacterium]
MFRVLVGALLVGLAAGCGSDPTGATAEVAFDFAFEDAVGDTTAATTNLDDVPAVDLIAVSGRVDAGSVRVVLEFADPISRWSDGLPNGLDGFIHFDVDQNAATPTLALAQGGEFYIDLRDNGFGKVGLVAVTARTITVLNATFDGTRFEVEVPRRALEISSDTDNRLDLLVRVGARNRAPLTDRGPDADDERYRLVPPGEETP